MNIKTPIFKFNDIETKLCFLISGEDLSEKALIVQQLFSEQTDKELFQISLKNQIVSHIAHVLKDLAVEFDYTDWEHEHEKVASRINSYLIELKSIASIFLKHDIKLIALKNSGIASGIVPCRGCNPMGDIDVLVNPEDFKKAHQLLEQNGFTLQFRNKFENEELKSLQSNTKDYIEIIRQSGGTEYWKLLPNKEKLWFELQWRPVAGRWLQPFQEPKAEELIERSIPAANSAVRLLAPEDNLLQVALHTAKHSYVRAPGMRLHTDVDRIVRKQNIDWDSFVKKVIKLQIKTAVYFSLLIPKQIFNTPIPISVLDKLKPSSLKFRLIRSLLRKAGLFNPEEAKFNRINYIFFTILLFDSFYILFKSIFPDKQTLCSTTSGKDKSGLGILYLKRLYNLLFKRTGI